MAKLRLDQAPPASVPRRFILTAPAWGVVAGALLLVDGGAALQGRWNPATLALVHAFTLGVLGNIMLGSILQFLPVAAGARVPGGRRVGNFLHALFNTGVAALVFGLHAGSRWLLGSAVILLPGAFALLAALTWPGLWRAGGQRLLRSGLAMAVGFAFATAVLGGVLAFSIGRRVAWPIPALTDIHAGWGVVGWILVLLGSVARVVMPMFQGTGSVPAPWQAAWLASVPLTLVAGGWLRLDGQAAAWGTLIAVHAALVAGAILWLQWRAARARRGPLLQSWRAGALLLAAAALVFAIAPRSGFPAAALVLLIALPMLLLGMAQEVIAFIGWIALQRRCGRGIQLPGVQRLLPAAGKLRVLWMQALPALLLGAAFVWPSDWCARTAGVAFMLTWALAAWTLDGVRRRVNDYADAVANSQPGAPPHPNPLSRR